MQASIIQQIFTFFQISYFYLLYKLNFISFHNFVKFTCIKLTKLSYYYIKIFQWQMQDKYLIDNELDDFFRQFTNNVPYNNTQINYQLLQDIITFSNDQLTIHNDLQPINSGTIALVWKGTYNGQQVAIKIIRDGVENEIKQCIQISCFFIYIFNLLVNFNNNNSYTFFIKENESNLLEQCNFNIEAQNIETFYNLYSNSSSIVIPKVYKEFTKFNSQVIVMDFIDGFSADKLTNENKPKFASIYNFFYNDSIFVKNICHSDLHIGNIVFIEDIDLNGITNYKIGIYDFGLIYKLTKQESKKLFKILTMLNNNNRKGIIETLVDFSLITDDTNKRQLLIESSMKLPIFMKDVPIDFNQINIMFKEAFKHNLMVNKNSSFILLSFLSSIYLSKIFAINKSVTQTFKHFLYSDTIKCD